MVLSLSSCFSSGGVNDAVVFADGSGGGGEVDVEWAFTFLLANAGGDSEEEVVDVRRVGALNKVLASGEIMLGGGERLLLALGGPCKRGL
jgi:hypothetical protein